MRPIPVHPRLHRRAKTPGAQRQLLACPRVSPLWELNAVRALIKPQMRGPIEHAPAQQHLPRGGRDAVEQVTNVMRERLGFEPAVHWPVAGDYWFAIEIAPEHVMSGRAMALLLSRRLPGLWLVMGRLYVCDGRFFRRRRGYKLELTAAANVHLPRDVRAAISGADPCRVTPSSANVSRRSRAAR